MNHFSTRQDFFLCSYASTVEEKTKIDKFLQFLDDSGVAAILSEVKSKHSSQGERPEINRYNLFATILYGFAFRNNTLREMEDICKYDLRYISLTDVDVYRTEGQIHEMVLLHLLCSASHYTLADRFIITVNYMADRQHLFVILIYTILAIYMQFLCYKSPKIVFLN